jgi:hypothetical protein
MEVEGEGTTLRELVVDRLDGNGTAGEALKLLVDHGATVTVALLVCTHRRFERCARTLIRDLAASDLLDEGELEELAHVLLFKDRVVFAVPAAWIASDLAPGTRLRAPGWALVGDVEQGRVRAGDTLPFACRVPAAARRWAATYLLRGGSADVETVIARARDLDASVGGAVLCGVLDAGTSLASERLELAVQAAIVWPRGSVRRRGLDVLADTGRKQEARDRAANDRAADVRRWRPPSEEGAPDPSQPTLLSP